MNVTIVSIQAVLHGRSPIVWLGDIEPEELAEVMGWAQALENPTEPALCEAFFRYFNRVDDEDVDRLEAIGYTMPSLSVGDLIHWDHVTYRVAGSGFEKLTDSSDYAMALTAYTLRTLSTTKAEIERGI